MTLLDLITRAMQDIKVLQKGEVPDADDAELALRTINDWIDALLTENLLFFREVRTTWTLTGAASYTIGTGATINVGRPNGPQDISAIGWINTSVTPNQDVLVDVFTNEEYESIAIKSLTGTYAAGFWFNPTFGVTGFGTIVPFPIPPSGTGVIYTAASVDEFAAVTDTVFVPTGYRRFYRTNLAVELAAAFDAGVTPELHQAAVDSKANVKRSNQRLSELSCGDAGALFGGGGGKSNLYTGP